MKPTSITCSMLQTEYRFLSIAEAIWWKIALKLRGVTAYRQGLIVTTHESTPTREL
jgi:hypothetical protein